MNWSKKRSVRYTSNERASIHTVPYVPHNTSQYIQSVKPHTNAHNTVTKHAILKKKKQIAKFESHEEVIYLAAFLFSTREQTNKHDFQINANIKI